jgi:hypothetical protein
MARGRASVQLYDNAEGDLAPMINERADLAIITGGLEAADGQCIAEPRSELSEQIIGQLKVAYDGLLSEPIPDHLRKLLADLCEAEDRS